MFSLIKQKVINFSEITGEMAILLWEIIYWLFHPPYNN